MSEPVLKQRPTIDLDDFERRLRQAAAAPDHRDDPLAELARLVGEPYDSLDDVFAQDAVARSGSLRLDGQHASHVAGGPASGADVPRLVGDFSAIEAGLRGALHDHAPLHGFAAPGRAEAGYVQAGQLPLDNEGEWAGIAAGEAHAAPGYGEADAAPRSRRPMVLMATSIAVGVIGIGAAFALKGRVTATPREVKTIMADATPTKIQPPEGAGDAVTTGEISAVQPTRTVGREEQPVDIGQAVQDNLARAAQPAASTDAASVPVPPSPGQMQGRADAAAAQNLGLGEMPAPKRVKVVAVRPDGSIVPNDAVSAGSNASASAPQSPAAAKAATPKAAAGKTTSRIAGKAADASAAAKPSADGSAGERTIDQLAAEGDDAGKLAHKGKPHRVASAEESAADAAPVAAAADGAGFSVQLAAPTSESDAKAASSRLSKRFATALGGHAIAIHKAESNGRSVFRVRVSNLTRADASSLCDKLKADGGTCFVAKK